MSQSRINTASIRTLPPFLPKECPRMHRMIFLLAAPFIVASTAIAAEPIKHRIMFAEYGKGPNRLVELDADGRLVWEHKFPSIAVIFQVLPNGHVLYAYGGKPTGVQEIDRDRKVV